jgi:hypothetical protein
MCRQRWLASLFTLIVVGALLGGPLGVAADAPAPAPALPPGSSVNAGWGTSSSDTGQGPELDVFVVGPTPNGMILHYDGHAWSPMPSGTSHWLCSGWGTSRSDVFAVGEGGTILHYDGSA